MKIEKAIANICAIPDYWVRMEQIRRIRGGIELGFGVHKGRRGKRIERWSILCRGVHEAKISHEDIGGISVYTARHPAAKQYVARLAELRWPCTCDESQAIGPLYLAHIQAVDDWIEFDRYLGIAFGWPGAKRRPNVLPITGDQFVLRGPDFLLRSYAEALNAICGPVKLTLRNKIKSKSGRPNVLHFGDSRVVAVEFEARKTGEANDE